MIEPVVIGDATLYCGGALEVLKRLEPESVQCVVTSPPYYGLRDYKHKDQLGLERTPQEYVTKLVDIFREVRRVLRGDGTVWLNLGSSYFSGTPESGGKPPMQITNAGSFFPGGKNPSQSHQRRRAPACGSDGKEPQDSLAPDYACPDLCDECRAAIQTHHDRNESTAQPAELTPPPASKTAHGSEHRDSVSEPRGALPPDAQESTSRLSSEPLPVECSHCGNCGACLSVLRSSNRDARLCARRAEYTSGSERSASVDHNRGMDASGMAWLKYTIFKPKDLVPTPWMVAMALQADGWYLRSDIIFSKPNPMPEPVRDRCTKAHEYIFLLSKSARYFYDHEAIKEPTFDGPNSPQSIASPRGQGFTRRARKTDKQRGHGRRHAGFNDRWDSLTKEEQCSRGRNKRSVWTIATRPYTGAHFATFSPELPRTCILAGTKTGDTVMDPFAGAGTTGEVALQLDRKFVGIELSPEYTNNLIIPRLDNAQRQGKLAI